MKNTKEQDEYYFFKEFIDDNWHIRVYKPILTEEENERRMAAIKKAAADVLKEQYRAKIKTNSEK